MPFWKKSEDPWDMEPGRPVSAAEKPEEGGGSLLDTVREWGEEVKTSFQKAEEPEGPPEVCPWCGKAMEKGYIVGGRDSVRWGREKPAFLSGLVADTLRVDDEGGFFHAYKTAWYCRDCRKMTFTLAPPEDLDTPEAQSQREYEEELRGYAEQAKQK